MLFCPHFAGSPVNSWRNYPIMTDILLSNGPNPNFLGRREHTPDYNWSLPHFPLELAEISEIHVFSMTNLRIFAEHTFTARIHAGRGECVGPSVSMRMLFRTPAWRFVKCLRWWRLPSLKQDRAGAAREGRFGTALSFSNIAAGDLIDFGAKGFEPTLMAAPDRFSTLETR